MTNFLRIVVAFVLLVGPIVSDLAAVALRTDGPAMQSGQGVPPEPVPPQSLPAQPSPPPPQSTAPESVPPAPQTEPPASTTPSKSHPGTSETKAGQQPGSHTANPASHKHKHKKHKKTEPSKEPGTGSGPTA